MNKIYKSVWNVSVKLSDKIFGTKKIWCMLLNTILWLFIGIVVYGISYLIFRFEFSFVYMWVVTGYIAVLFGYSGGAMYIIRNTEPEDLE